MLSADWRTHYTAVAFSADGKYIAADGTPAGEDKDEYLILRDATRRTEVRRWKRPTCLYYSIAISTDSKFIAFATRPPSVEIIEIPDGRRRYHLLENPEGEICSVALSPDGRLLAAIDTYGGGGMSPGAATLHICRLDTRKEIHRARLDEFAYAVSFSPDGRSVVTGRGREVLLWEVATMGVRLQLRREPVRHHDIKFVGPPSFSPDGKVLATACDDSTVWLWDTSGLELGGDTVKSTLSDQELADYWSDLTSDDAARAYRALGRLAAVPTSSIAFLRKRLLAAQRAAAPQIGDLIKKLGDVSVTERDEAARELEGLGSAAREALAQALRQTPSADVRTRVEQILRDIDTLRWNRELLRIIRAVEGLERMDSKEARQLLKELAAGQPERLLTREAKGSLERLTKRLSTR